MIYSMFPVPVTLSDR